MKNADLFRYENDYPDLDWKRAVDHLRQAVRFRTVSYMDTGRIDGSQFAAFHRFLRESYPLLSRHAAWEEIGRSLLITLSGRDPNLRPGMFMAHQDVVPVVPGTEKDWIHDPFSGDLSDGYIWGRGTMDIKQMLIGELEAAEYLLSQGRNPERTVIFAFGEDEETRSTGAMAIASELERRGIELEYILDEGSGDVTDAADWGAPGVLICTIGMYEKGYADLRLSVRSQGGHSSNPFRGTSLGKLAEAITEVLRHPASPSLSDAVLISLQTLSPRMQEPMKTWASRPNDFEKEILAWFDGHESLYHLTRTTIAPTMISGGAPAGNIMPQDMSAVINFRLIPKDTPESLMNAYRAILPDEVDLFWEQQICASNPSDTRSMGYRALKRTLEHYFDQLVFLPTQNRGATDARNYEKRCRCVMRFGPFLEEEDISAEGIHGTNERISVRAYAQGIRVLTRMMEDTCFAREEQNA